jgi:tRNA G26 N,N-dimethylase Trm1
MSIAEKAAPEGYKVLQEGKARILYRIKDNEVVKSDMKETEEEVKGDNGPKRKMKRQEKDEFRDAVFYNPVQEFNRDLSILCITQHGKEVQEVCDKFHILF